MSLPLRKCGLKYQYARMSHLTLRHFPCGSVDWNIETLGTIMCGEVTSLAEVWIEIQLLRQQKLWITSLPLRKCGLKSGQWWVGYLPAGHFPCGSVDWNRHLSEMVMRQVGHFPCGSVDWNCRQLQSWYFYAVTSLAEVWIEMQCQKQSWPGTSSLPSRKCGLKSELGLKQHTPHGHFPRGSVDWNTKAPFSDLFRHPSLPSRKCGLKYGYISRCRERKVVTSLAEVWIEIWSPYPRQS